MKIFMETNGCSANQADTETMKGLLIQAGHTFVDTLEGADIVIQNTCTVKGPTESKFLTKLKKLEETGKKLLITGCIAQTEPKQLKNHSTLGVDNVTKIVEAVNAVAKGQHIKMTQRSNDPARLNLPKTRSNKFIEIVPICKGCLGSCTFCKTKHARGHLYSYAPGEIVRQIKSAVAEGVKEIWLTSQDNTAYGYDITYNLAKLLRDIVALEGDFKVRVGMANPDLMPDFIDELIEVYKDPKIYKFLHLPAQCGSNKVLKDMQRQYTIEQYKEIIKRFKKAIPDITIATDIIVAFPEESNEEFKETLQLIQDTTPDVVNLSRFWPRPGTPAARMKQIDGATSKQRAKMTQELFESNATHVNQKWIGWEGEILITEKGKEGQLVGRNYAYKPVIITSDEALLGQKVRVKIVDATKFDLRAHVINANETFVSFSQIKKADVKL